MKHSKLKHCDGCTRLSHSCSIYLFFSDEEDERIDCVSDRNVQ